jgi:hypothetical protein
MVSSISQAQAIGGFVLDQIEKGFIPTLRGLLPSVAVSGDGHAIRVLWQPVYGATRAEVTSAVVRIGVAVVDEQLGDLALATSGAAYVVSIPNGKRIAALTLHGMKDVNGNPISSQSTLPNTPEQHRLVVQTQQGNRAAAPIHAMPPVPARGMIPSSLTGASFSSSVLSLPNIPAAKLRLSLAIKPFPEEFDEQPFTLDRVSAVAAIYPLDLQLVGPDSAVLWEFPGEYPPSNPPFDFDLRVYLEAALNAALKAEPPQPLDITFRLTGAAPSKAGFAFDPVQGALVRDFPKNAIMSVALEGDPVALPIGDRLADEAPSAVIADLTVTYSGIRILEELSDTLPPGPIGGLVVGDQPIARAYPPQALVAIALARIGIIGCVPLGVPECELAVQIVRMVGDQPGEPLGAPSVITITAANTMRTHWIVLPAGIDLSHGNIGITARATRGRFLWASDAARPLAKLAIHDPNPGSRPLRLNGAVVHTIARVDEDHMPALQFTPSLFRSTPPVFDSPLFLTVDVSDLTLRYAR